MKDNTGIPLSEANPQNRLVLQLKGHSQPPFVTNLLRTQHQSVFDHFTSKYRVLNPILLTVPDPRCRCAACKLALAA